MTNQDTMTRMASIDAQQAEQLLRKAKISNKFELGLVAKAQKSIIDRALRMKKDQDFDRVY